MNFVSQSLCSLFSFPSLVNYFPCSHHMLLYYFLLCLLILFIHHLFIDLIHYFCSLFSSFLPFNMSTPALFFPPILPSSAPLPIPFLNVPYHLLPLTLTTSSPSLLPTLLHSSLFFLPSKHHFFSSPKFHHLLLSPILFFCFS